MVAYNWSLTVLEIYNHLFFTVLRIGFAAMSYFGSKGGFVQPVVRAFSGVLIGSLTASVQFRTIDGMAVGEFLCIVCMIFPNITLLILLHAAPGDYNTTVFNSSQILVFNSSQIQITVPIAINDDDFVEEDETFSAMISLSVPTPRVTLDPNSTALTITDIDSELETMYALYVKHQN